MISIIVPVYNISEYLSICVDSLLKQTYRDLEILLVDDGSTDNSGTLCDTFAHQDGRIHVIHKENGGLSDARNAGLDKAKGEWILFVDGDDYLVPDAVELLIPLTRPDVDFIQFHYQETDGTWQPETQSVNGQICTDPKEMFYKLYEKGGVYASSCTKLWNKRIFDDIRFQKGTLHEDEELLNRVLSYCKNVIYTDLVLYGYVMRSDSIVHSAFKPKQMDIFPIMEHRVTVLEEMGLNALAQQTQAKMFQTAVWQYCLAKKNGFQAEANQLKQKVLAGAKENNLPLSGQYRILHKAARISPFAVNLYYLVRKITGKT